MNFSTRVLKEKDYELLESWGDYFRSPIPPRNMLPESWKHTIMVQYEGKDICTAFAYATSAPELFWLEYVISNPLVTDRDLRKSAIVFLIESYIRLIKQSGGKVIFTNIKNQNLINHFLDAGFVIGSGNTQELIKIL